MQVGGRLEGSVQIVIGGTEASLSPSDAFTLEVLKRLVEREKMESESSGSSESSESLESLVLEYLFRLITGSINKEL